MLPKIRLLDKQFSHNPECSFGVGDLKIKPTFFEWDRTSIKADNDIVVMTESCMQLVDMQTESIKILLILEPYCISPYTYDWIKRKHNYQKFNYILTYCEELLLLDNRFVKYIWGGSWVKPEDRQIYPKTKNISIIASWKKGTFGQMLRHKIIEKFDNRIDVYGNGYRFVENKLEALRDYRFSIVIENNMYNNWVTEKYLDCLATGTMPIYWGCPNINDFFNCDGHYKMADLNHLEYMLSHIDEDFYKERLNAIEDNFERAKEFYLPEDRLYQTFFKPVLGL